MFFKFSIKSFFFLFFKCENPLLFFLAVFVAGSEAICSVISTKLLNASFKATISALIFLVSFSLAKCFSVIILSIIFFASLRCSGVKEGCSFAITSSSTTSSAGASSTSSSSGSATATITPSSTDTTLPSANS